MKLFSKLFGILILVCFIVILTWGYPIEDRFTKIYVWIQFVFAFVAIAALWSKKNWDTQTNTTASMLTVIGIFGTFLGIYRGLDTFNAMAIEASIPGLLQGLKLAFLTSLVGIGSALNLKFIALFQERRDLDGEAINKFANVLKSVKTSGDSELSSKLERLTTAIEKDGKTTRDVLGNMGNSLTDMQGKTLAQLETLTNTVSNKNDLIIASQKDEATETRKTLTDMQSELTDRQNKAFIQLRTLTKTISSEHNQLRTDNEITRDVLGNMGNSLTDIQGKTLAQLETLTNTVSNKNDLIIASQKDEATETRKTLTDMQSELTDRQNKAFIQLRTLTKTISSEHNQLRTEFENFSKNVAESITELATKEFISSLTKVIGQFNTQLSTQFGDNFKQLNEAVGKTVKWQDQYCQQMDKLADEFRIAAKSIDDSRDSLQNIADASSTIADKSGSIVTSATKLEPILHTLNDQLGAFSDLREKANDAFPLIEKRLDNLTTKFSSTVEKTIADSEESMKTQRDTLEDQSTKLTDQFSQFKNVIDGLDDFTNQIDGVKTNLSDAVGDFQKSMNLQKQAVSHFNDSVATMESTLDQQLRKSIEDLGKDLAALSQHFVDDYTPLTQSLRQVLTIADGILPKQPGN